MRNASTPTFAAAAGSLLLSLFSTAAANVALNPPFSDHMVLQRRMGVPVWGTASAGEAVTVAFRGQSKAATAGADGKWKVALDATEAGGPFTLSVTGKNTVTLQDVMVGEVWLAGGQSNMAFNMKTIGGPNVDSAAVANQPNLRLMYAQSGGKWNVCTPAVALEFAATAFYYGRYLQQQLNVPVGIMCSAIGGTEIERWLDPESIAADPLIAKDTAAGLLYNKWITPLAGYAIRGAIWYQGEYNARTTFPEHPAWVVANYRNRFKALIGGWRKAWGQGEFLFHYVQLPNINGAQTNPGEPSPWAELREAQRLSLTNPGTAMAVTIDIGMADNLHPYNKWDVGRRLVLAARAKAYGETNVVFAGPMYKSMRIEGKTIKLVFRDAEGLTTKNGAKPAGFSIAGADDKWSWADAVIRKDTVIVSSATIASPTKVRYGWGQNPPCNLYNAAGLPASPFQTDGAQLPVAIAPKPPSIAAAPRSGRIPAASDALGREQSKGLTAHKASYIPR
jgi:sialate O-acetylesterase